MKTPPTAFTTSPLRLDFSHRPCAPMRDESLMKGIQAGDASALDKLLDRYRLLLRSVILRVVHDHASADDVMQEATLEIWKQAGHYSPAKGRPLAWIVTLSKRRAIDHLRRRLAYTSARDRLQNTHLHQPPPSEEDAAAKCEQSDLGRVLSEQIDRLPQPQQEVIRLGFLNGMSQREIAHSTRTPLGTVKTRMELALKKLRIAFHVSPQHTLQAC